MSSADSPTAEPVAGTKRGANTGWLAGASAILGAVSTAIGIYVAIGNYYIQQEAEQQKLRIEAADELLRERADVRAQATTERDYIIRVYDKVSEALQSTDERRHRVALALIETLPDPALRVRLGQAFLQLGNNVSPAVTAQAQRITNEAEVASAYEKTIAPGWNYVVQWCVENPSNRDLAATVVTALSRGARPGNIRLVRYVPSERFKASLQAAGLQIRSEDNAADQVAGVKELLDKGTNENFVITPALDPAPHRVNVYVCR